MTITTGPTGPRDGGELLLALLAAVFGTAAIVWAAAVASTGLWHGELPDLDLGQSLHAIPSLVETPAKPGAAFDIEPFAPAGLFWALLALATVLAGLGVWKVTASFGTVVGTTERQRLGVSTEARMARRRDLAPLIVKGPEPGRLILGKACGRLVATEDRAAVTSPTPRTGDRSSVAVIGPTRCGKTANTITSVLEWTGPAVLSSVKSDLLNATIERRHELGDVRVFDPAGLTGYDSCGWSPLRGIDSAVDAMKRSQHLSDALPDSAGSNMDFFKAMADQLLWPMLFAAAVSDRTIADVVRWINTQDRPNRDVVTDIRGERRRASTSEVATLLERQLHAPDPDRQRDAQQAIDTIDGVWTADERTRGNTYSTASALVRAWADPTIASVGTVQPAVDLDWLLSGNNTLYVIAPEHDFARLSVVYGALFGDLLTQAYEHTTRTGRPLDPTLLFVLDEAAQTPVDWLPSVASTCAGIGVLLVTIWQSIAQMHVAFGRHADTVLTNHGSKLFFSGISDPATLDYVNKLVGDEEVHTRSASADLNPNAGHRRSTSDATIRLSLLPGDTLRRGTVGDALLLHGTLPPAHLTSRPWFSET